MLTYSLKRSNVKKWWKAELKKTKSVRRDHALWIITESGVADEWGEDFPNGNLILREDYRRLFKAKVRWKDTKKFLRVEGLGEVYPSYTNAELERLVYRPSRVQDVHDGYDRKKQCVKTADVWGIEKVWEAIHEDNRQLGNFTSKTSNLNSCRIFYSQ